MDNKNNTFHFEKRSKIETTPKKKSNDLVKLGLIFTALTILVIIPASIYVGVVIARSDSSKNSKVSVVYVEKETAVKSYETDGPVAGVCNTVSGSIAEITTTNRTVLSNGTQERQTQKCNGIVWSKADSTSYIVTSYHSVAGATELSVSLCGSTAEGTLVAYDEKSDIALLKCEISGASSVIVDKATVELGQSVVAVGFTSTSEGIINELATGESQTLQNSYLPMVGTNAVLENGGNGSGLFNMNGALVGMVAYSGRNDQNPMSFVIPSSDLCDIVDELITSGYVKGRVDMSFAEIQRKTNGSMVVVSVNDETCGLNVGDVIVKINTINILKHGDWVSSLLSLEVGDKVVFTVMRGGKETTLEYILKEKTKKEK